MKAIETYTRWFVYAVGGVAVLVIVISIGRFAFGSAESASADRARWQELEVAEAAKKAKYEADEKAAETVRKAKYEADERAADERKNAERSAVLASLGTVRCVVTLRHSIQKQPAQLIEEFKKQNLPVAGNIVRYAEVTLRSGSTDQIFTYQSDSDFRLSPDMPDEYRTREFILLRPQAEKCLAEFVGGQRNAEVGRSGYFVRNQ